MVWAAVIQAPTALHADGVFTPVAPTDPLSIVVIVFSHFGQQAEADFCGIQGLHQGFGEVLHADIGG